MPGGFSSARAYSHIDTKTVGARLLKPVVLIREYIPHCQVQLCTKSPPKSIHSNKSAAPSMAINIIVIAVSRRALNDAPLDCLHHRRIRASVVEALDEAHREERRTWREEQEVSKAGTHWKTIEQHNVRGTAYLQAQRRVGVQHSERFQASRKQSCFKIVSKRHRTTAARTQPTAQ